MRGFFGQVCTFSVNSVDCYLLTQQWLPCPASADPYVCFHTWPLRCEHLFTYYRCWLVHSLLFCVLAGAPDGLSCRIPVIFLQCLVSTAVSCILFVQHRRETAIIWVRSRDILSNISSPKIEVLKEVGAVRWSLRKYWSFFLQGKSPCLEYFWNAVIVK